MKFLCCCVCLSCFALLARAEPEDATLAATVAEMGRINGLALACGYREVANRARAIMVARIPKVREQGERFEQATNTAFLTQGTDQSACPPRAALTVQLETAARPLSPPASHQFVNAAAAPEQGFNPRYLLQATNGRAITDSDFRDRFQLITFGYTFCPDICPTTLAEIATVMQQLGEQAKRIQPIFISLDPERDTLKHLHQYLEFFDKRIIGATASPELVKRAAESFKVRFEKAIGPAAAPEHYAIDHSAGIYLLAPGGQFLARFPYGMPPAGIVDRINMELKLRQDRTDDAK